MPRLCDIPKTRITDSGLIHLIVWDKKQPQQVQAFQVPSFLEVHDFLQGVYGKSIRKSALLFDDNRCIAKSKSQTVEINVV